MKIGTRIIGLIAWLIVGGHMAWSAFHDARARHHSRRKSDHETKRDARLAEAGEVEATARKHAPPKPKPEIPPPAEKRALAVIAKPPAAPYQPRTFAHGGNDA